jgi:GNAT superfamily N-acetyltransferase
MHPVPRISKADSRADAQRLLDFFTGHEFMGVENARRVFAEGPSDLWLAEADGRLVGALLAVEQLRAGGRVRGCVENCLVDPQCRREGLARRLMEVAEAHYRDRGLAGMEFAVRKQLEPNAALLESGYVIVREYEKDKRDWDGNLVRDQERCIMREDF